MAVPRHRQSNSGFAVGRISTAFGESGAHLHKMSPLFSAEAGVPALVAPSVDEPETAPEVEAQVEPQGEAQVEPQGEAQVEPQGEPQGETQVEAQGETQVEAQGETQVEVTNLNDLNDED